MKRVTATLASLALATGLAAPTASVANEGEDLAKVIAGIAALAIIAKAVDDRNERKEAAAIKPNQSAQQVNRSRSPGYQPINRNARQPRYIDQPTYGRLIEPNRTNTQRRGVRANPLPASCERLVRTSRGDRLVYGAGCLGNTWNHARHLPNSCRVVIDTPRGQAAAYSARCLRRDGWRVAQR